MILRKLGVFFSLVFIFLTIGAKANFAQNKVAENSAYSIYANTILGSNKSDSSVKLPSEISDALNKLSGNYNYTNYRKLSTHFQMIESKGTFNQKGIIKDLVSAKENSNPSFASWLYSGLDEKNEIGTNMVGFRDFIFELRIPVNFNRYIDSNGSPTEGLKYQTVSTALRNMIVPLNETIVFATLPIDMNDETLFFVIKIVRNK